MPRPASKRRILALGLFAPRVGGEPRPRGMGGVVAAARARFPDESDEIVTIRSLSDFEEDFASLTDELTEEQARGPFRGIASGYFVQEALEGGHGVADICYDLTGVESLRDPTHAGSELRSLVAHIRAVHPRRVDIHFATASGLSTLRKESSRFEGQPLPPWLAGRLPNSGERTR